MAMYNPPSRSEQLQLWQRTLQAMQPTIDEVLQDYEAAYLQVPEKDERFIHEQLSDNLRARFGREKGTCEGYWYHKAQEQTSNILLSKKMERAFESVVRFRSFEVSLISSQNNLQDDNSFEKASESCERMFSLQPQGHGQDILGNHLDEFVPAQRASSFLPRKSSAADICPVHKVLRRTKSWVRPNRILPRTKPCPRSSWVLPKTRAVSKDSMHPPMLCSKNNTSPQQRYANYYQQLSAAYQNCQQSDTRISQIDFSNLSKSF